MQLHFVIEHHPTCMMWEREMLSRYNRSTDRWREESAKETAREESATLEVNARSKSATTAPREKGGPMDQSGGSGLGKTDLSRTEAFTLMVAALRPSAASYNHRLSTLPSIWYAGGPLLLSRNGALWELRHPISVATIIGTPVKEATSSIGMEPCQAIIHLKHDMDGTLPVALVERHTTQGTTICTTALEELSDSGTSQIDWMASIYSLSPSPIGQEDRAAEAWDQDMMVLANYMALRSGIQATTFLIPKSWPTASKTISNIGPGHASWTSQQATLRNTCHRGEI